MRPSVLSMSDRIICSYSLCLNLLHIPLLEKYEEVGRESILSTYLSQVNVDEESCLGV